MFSGVLRPRHKPGGSLGLWGRLLRPSHLGLGDPGEDTALTPATSLGACWVAQVFSGHGQKFLGRSCMRTSVSDAGSPQGS